MGVLADRYGRRMVLVPSLFLFVVAGVACALVTGFGLLLVLRTLQGVGAAALGAINITVVATNTEDLVFPILIPFLTEREKKK